MKRLKHYFEGGTLAMMTLALVGTLIFAVPIPAKADLADDMLELAGWSGTHIVRSHSKANCQGSNLGTWYSVDSPTAKNIIRRLERDFWDTLGEENGVEVTKPRSASVENITTGLKYAGTSNPDCTLS